VTPVCALHLVHLANAQVELHGVDFSKFTVPPCTVCASEGHEKQVVKPNVVFFVSLASSRDIAYITQRQARLGKR
jgi:hypothetical protein